MQLRTDGIVINQQSIGESDILVTLLTRGCYFGLGKKRQKDAFQIWNSDGFALLFPV